jgi:tRNA-specific 2-thiouridylase
VLCNKEIKWGLLLEKAAELGAEFIATGHYAKIKKNGRYYFSAAEDKSKDQSYALWRVSQEAIGKTIFPLGEITKTKTREIAREIGLKPAGTPDSQEICFVPGDDYRKLLNIRMPELTEKISGGDLIYHDRVIGKHTGYINYTIGQRRGLNVSIGKPIYVSKIDSENNIVYVDDEKGLFSGKFTVSGINMQKVDSVPSPMKVKVKIRYKDEAADAVIEQTGPDTISVILNEPKKSVTPGQSAVFYDGFDVIGGGIID